MREPREPSNKFMDCNILASKLAKNNSSDNITIEHFLVAMIDLKAGVGYTLLQECDTSIKALRKELYGTFAKISKNELMEAVISQPAFTKELIFVLEDSEKISRDLQHDLTCTGHFLLAVLRGDSRASDILAKFGLTFEIARQQYIDIINNAGTISDRIVETPSREAGLATPSANSRTSNKKAPKGSAIDAYCVDLTERAKQGKLDPMIGREAELQRLLQILARKSKNNPVLIGESGTGKSAIVEGLALKIVSQDAPESLRDKRLCSVDLGSLVAGTKYRGQFEERLKQLIKELEDDPNIIAVVDEMHTLAGAGAAEGSIDASNMIKQPLARGTLRLIGLTTTEEYRKFIEKDRALDRRFQPIVVNATNRDQTLEILKGLKPKYEDFHGVTYQDSALLEAVRLADKYIPDRNFPDKAIDIIDEVGARAKLRILDKPENIIKIEEEIAELDTKWNALVLEEAFEKCEELDQRKTDLEIILRKENKEWLNKVKEKSYLVETDEVLQVVSTMTSVPLTKLRSEEDKAKYKNMDAELAKRVVSQKEAIAALSRAMKRSRTGLKEPNKPMGSFLFLGPTGVGKTELAKALADYVFGDENALLTLDMSEYQERHDAARLTGAAPGYIGHDNAGVFEPLRRRPYTVILVDEIEKAHPDVLMAFLQILEEGRITDSKKNVISFKNAVIIMTSNVGSKKVKNKVVGLVQNNGVEENAEREKERYMEAAKKQFRAEFLNRLDGIHVFRHLSKEDCYEILDIHINKYNSKNLGEQNLHLELTQSIKDKLIKEGYDEEYGFRPLKRIFQTVVLDPLSEFLLDLDESLEKRLVIADLEDDKVVFASQERSCEVA